jgi:D-glycero-alpha-D-manno-heptose 1-phosphate guanylyltransferase
MKAIILAGGKGTRLQKVIDEIPKPMAPIAGRPFLEYLVLQLKSWGINDIVLSIGYKKEIIKSYFSSGAKLGVNITYVEEDIPLGTGGAIREAIKNIDDRDVMVMNGDSFFNADISALIDYHGSRNAVATLALRKMDDTGRYGRVEIEGSGEVICFKEKQNGRKGYINAGLYLLNRKILAFLSHGTISFENEVLPVLAGKGLYGLIQPGFFIDMGIPEDYLRLCDDHKELLLG